MNLAFVPGEYAIGRLDPREPVPPWAMVGTAFWTVSRSADELSIVAEERLIPADVRSERGYALLRIAGTLPMDAVGVLAGIARTLAADGISIVCIGTYDTDYFLIKRERLAEARLLLERAGYTFV